VFGVALISVPVVVAAEQLHISAPAQLEPASLAVVPHPRQDAAPAVAVAMLVEVKDCSSDVNVTVVAQPTTEYWVKHDKPATYPTSVDFALPDARRDKVRYELGRSASDVINPGDVVERPAPRDNSGIEATERYEGANRDLLVAHLAIPQWHQTLAPAIARYSADWLEHRGLGSCWLRTPSLTGDLTVLAAMRALNKARSLDDPLPANPGSLRVSSSRVNAQAVYEPGLDAIHGSITVVTPEGEVGESMPPPPGSTSGSPTWTCEPQSKANPQALDTNPKPGVSVLSGTAAGASAGAFSAKIISSAEAGDCSAVAAVTEASAGWHRDLFMLVVGALTGLGFTTLVDFVKHRRRTEASEGER
jgi:hypothetical protein